jgi:hypothetical protein
VRARQLIREQLIAYIRKYRLEKIVIYLLADRVLDFKIPEYHEPYIFQVYESIDNIKNSLLTRPEGNESLTFKFRRMVKDLYRRTVVKILNTETDKEASKKLKKQWTQCLGSKLTFSFTDFKEEDFKSAIISNYFDFIVVSNSTTFAFIRDMKKVHKFESEIIYHGNIEEYGRGEYS